MMAAEEIGAVPTVASPSAREAIQAVADEFTEFGSEVVSRDPIAWPGYRKQLRRAQKRADIPEAVVTGHARIGGTPVVIVAFDFRFLGGSMSEAVGERIVQAFARARTTQQPIVTLTASGGARMQEGMCSLVQMQRIAAACAQTRAAGVPHIGVLRHPTTGGVWASLAASADVIIAVQGATVSFAGSRVRGNSDRDAAAFTSAGKYQAGFIDVALPAADVPAQLARLIAMLAPPVVQHPLAAPDVPAALGTAQLPRGAWAAVLRARAADRPRAEAYLDAYFEERFPISGDRAGGVDDGMRCGFGRHAGRTIAYAAQCGTANSAAGFRTAQRLLATAQRLQLPVLTLIDTPGAMNGAEAERAGIGTAIAELFGTVAALTVPMTSLVIGEGGSGGALALAAPHNLWMTPDSYFAVIAPEAAASILKLDPSEVRPLAERMRLRPQDLVRLGIVHGIAPARFTAAHAQQRVPYRVVRHWVRHWVDSERIKVGAGTLVAQASHWWQEHHRMSAGPLPGWLGRRAEHRGGATPPSVSTGPAA
jgi:acetyl-CoA carboxylase beta subunit